jgi:hypothetical protein
MKGHRLEIISARGGLYGTCMCGKVYKSRQGRSPDLFATYERDKIRELHQLHVYNIKTEKKNA